MKVTLYKVVFELTDGEGCVLVTVSEKGEILTASDDAKQRISLSQQRRDAIARAWEAIGFVL